MMPRQLVIIMQAAGNRQATVPKCYRPRRRRCHLGAGVSKGQPTMPRCHCQCRCHRCCCMSGKRGAINSAKVPLLLPSCTSWCLLSSCFATDSCCATASRAPCGPCLAGDGDWGKAHLLLTRRCQWRGGRRWAPWSVLGGVVVVEFVLVWVSPWLGKLPTCWRHVGPTADRPPTSGHKFIPDTLFCVGDCRLSPNFF